VVGLSRQVRRKKATELAH